MDVDVAVIGRGMIGSAAARHLAETGTSIALIGPGEPVDRQVSPGPFSSHPDAGRITRIIGRTPVWSTLAARSIDRYGDIESRSGIGFYTNCGVVAAFDDAGLWIENAGEYDLEASLVSSDWLRSTTGIRVAEGLQIVHERFPGGHINPRRLVAAQTRLASLAGGLIIEGAAAEVRRDGGRFSITGPWGHLSAGRVLLATGAFGAELVDSSLQLERRARTTLMAEVTGIQALPDLIADAPDERLNEIYWVPPVRYPDGRMRIKIGGDMVDTRLLAPGDLVGWFHTDGDDNEIDALDASLRSLLPDAEFSNFVHAPCVITGTLTGYPYIGWVDDGLAVAIGGNGSSAKSSDELGRLASTLFCEQGWADSLDLGLFEPQFG